MDYLLSMLDVAPAERADYTSKLALRGFDVSCRDRRSVRDG